MAPRAEKRQTRTPQRRSAGGGLFFPNEVVRILGLQRIDYRQLRRLFRLVRRVCGSPVASRKWARFSFTELACLRVAIDLAGGVDALATGRRLRLKAIENACRALTKRYGVQNPLLHARMRREGNAVVAVVDDVTFAPATGQLTLGLLEAASEHVADVDPRAVCMRTTTKMRKEHRAIEVRRVGQASRSSLEVAVVGQRR